MGYVSLPEGTQIEMKTVPLVRVEEGKARLEMAGIRRNYFFLTELESFLGKMCQKRMCLFVYSL